MQPGFEAFLILDRAQVLQGQLWRLVTWVFVIGKIHLIFLFFMVMIMWMMGDALEKAWGAFRVNLYIFGGIVSVIIGTMIFGFNPEGVTLYTTIFLAFARLFPDFELMLFFILPVKVKYLGMITGALVLLNFIASPDQRLPILFSMVNFFVAFGPGFIKGVKTRAVVAERRSRFDSAKAATVAEGHFHKCDSCGKTDAANPNLEFRVTETGEEFCSECRPTKPRVKV